MKIFLKSILASVFLFVLISFSFQPAFAQITTVPNAYVVPNAEANVQPGLHTWTQAVMTDVLSSFLCQLTGVDVTIPDHKCLGVNAISGKLGYVQDNSGGLIGITSQLVGDTFNIPVHTSTYIAYLKDNFGFVKSAHAASGTGFDQLSPLQNIWVVIRNIAYLIITIVFMVIGIAIMLRVKIDPRTVMSIENQLPKIVISLVLITLLLAISGLVIDAGNILISLLINIYGTIPGINHNNLTFSTFQNSTPLSIVGKFVPSNVPVIGEGTINSIIWPITVTFGNSLKTILGIHTLTYNPIDPRNILTNPSDLFSILIPLPGIEAIKNPNGFSFFDWLISAAASFLDISGVWRFIVQPNSSGEGPISGGVAMALGATAYAATIVPLRELIAGSVPYLLVYVIIFLALFIAMVRLLFTLITAWVTILYYVCLGPLFVVFGLVPGSKIGFGSWLKELAANVLTFPIAAGIMLLGSAMIQTFSTSGSNQIYTPILVGGGQIPAGAILAAFVFFVAGNSKQLANDMFDVKESKSTGALGAAAGASLQTLSTAGRGTFASVSKTPQPGEKGGVVRGVETIWR